MPNIHTQTALAGLGASCVTACPSGHVDHGLAVAGRIPGHSIGPPVTLIGTTPSVQPVIAALAEQAIIPAPTEQPVVARPTEQEIRPAAPE